MMKMDKIALTNYLVRSIGGFTHLSTQNHETITKYGVQHMINTVTETVKNTFHKCNEREIIRLFSVTKKFVYNAQVNMIITRLKTYDV